jgi:hypothetical protein
MIELRSIPRWSAPDSNLLGYVASLRKRRKKEKKKGKQGKEGGKEGRKKERKEGREGEREGILKLTLTNVKRLHLILWNRFQVFFNRSFSR